MSLSHTDAKAYVDALGLTPAESLYLRAVAWHETNYGAGWKPGFGAGSNNMGAVTTLNPDQYSFRHDDSKFDPSQGKVVPYTTWFAGYPTPAAGFAGLRDTLLKSNVRAALNDLNLDGAVLAQYLNKYFAGLHSHVTAEGNAANVADYTASLKSALDTIYAHTLEARLLPKAGATGEVAPSSPPLPSGVLFSRGDVVPDGDARLRILRLGMIGPLIRVWQKLLGVSSSGNFDLSTEAATREWQAKQGLPADGVVGVMSWSRILA